MPVAGQSLPLAEACGRYLDIMLEQALMTVKQWQPRRTLG